MKTEKLVLLDLFSGTGGFALGLKEAGFQFSKHYFSEIDKYAISNYRYNFSKAHYAGPVEKIKKGQIEKPDIITFGFPCQDLSFAGKRKGLKGKRSNLFFEALRIIEIYKPSVFLFENVKGLFSCNEGRDFETVIKATADLGLYHCQWQLLNTSWFLPQNRERIYFVGTLGNKAAPKIFPFTESCFGNKERIKKEAQTRLAPAIMTSSGKGGHYCPYVLKAANSNKKELIRVLDTGNYDQYDTSGKQNRSQTERVYHPHKAAPAQTTKSNIKIYSGKKMSIRRLTPTECERLQGFPDHWTMYGIIDKKKVELSDTQRYKLTGNAVSVPVVKAVGLRLKGYFV